jgi:hypothetical protein
VMMSTSASWMSSTIAFSRGLVVWVLSVTAIVAPPSLGMAPIMTTRTAARHIQIRWIGVPSAMWS